MCVLLASVVLKNRCLGIFVCGFPFLLEYHVVLFSCFSFFLACFHGDS